MQQKILLIDDDAKLAGLLGSYFERFSMSLISALKPDAGMRALRAEKPDLVILDIMLPDKDGFEVCREIRAESSTPIIMLTARGDVTDRVVGLELGADDYLPKPFEPRELVARIQTVIRRFRSQNGSPRLNADGLTVDFDQRAVSLDGRALNLTTMEFALLELMARNRAKTLTRDQILNDLKGIDAEIFSRAVDNLVSRLRQKLGDTSREPRFIHTVWGKGYMFLPKPLDGANA